MGGAVREKTEQRLPDPAGAMAPPEARPVFGAFREQVPGHRRWAWLALPAVGLALWWLAQLPVGRTRSLAPRGIGAVRSGGSAARRRAPPALARRAAAAPGRPVDDPARGDPQSGRDCLDADRCVSAGQRPGGHPLGGGRLGLDGGRAPAARRQLLPVLAG